MTDKKNEQASLFGGFAKKDKATEPLHFVSIRDETPTEGDHFAMDINVAKYNDQKDCMTVIDSNQGKALTVYFENYDPTWTATPDGVRLFNAVERGIKAPLGSKQAFVDAVNNNDLTLTVEYVGGKGRLWTVAPQQ